MPSVKDTAVVELLGWLLRPGESSRVERHGGVGDGKVNVRDIRCDVFRRRKSGGRLKFCFRSVDLEGSKKIGGRVKAAVVVVVHSSYMYGLS
jgi:hypothetical protein